jgi:PilZ domain
MEERRKHLHHWALKSGKIAFNQRASVVDCTIRDLSETGACLHVASTIGIPDNFELLFEVDKQYRGCRIVWRSENKIGVAFQ